jgi:hypothetical protein
MGCETIVQVFFHMLLNIKLYHWETTSYARHKASDDLHSGLSGLIDQFVEVYMGRYRRPEYKTSFRIQVKQLDDTSILNALSEYIAFLKEEVPKYVSESDTDILNIRDEMLGCFNKTLYLFTLN